MTQMLQQPTMPELVPVKITLEQYHRMVDVGIWDDCHVELLNGVIRPLARIGGKTVKVGKGGIYHDLRATQTPET